jgi:pimeloyl-ACP methyl ester carboxylesterase
MTATSPKAATWAPRSLTRWAARRPRGLLGIHMNLLLAGLADGCPSADPTEAERAALDAVVLAAWMLDHDTDAYYKISRAFVDGQPSGGLTRDHVLDNITLYWLTGTGASAARSYWENTQAAAHAAGQPRPEVKLPVGFTTFPGEIFRAPRSWVEKSYPNVTYFHQVDKGGHFAAWEEPELFATEIRAAFKPLR